MNEKPDPLTDTCARRFPEFPGLWEDANGAMHFSIVEFHEAHGFPLTPDEIEETREMVMGMFAKVLPPGTPVTFRPAPPTFEPPLS